MSWELVYTSVPQGLKPGSRGFCPVAMTRGIPTALLERLESLSGYRHLFAPQDPNARLNPPAWSHLIANLGGKRYHLLSYVGDAGLDYSQRTNKLAHHVACEPMELTPAGPAGSLQQPGFLLTQWQSEPAQWPAGRAIPRTETRPGPCAAWQRVAGDAGWAGVLAETIFNRREVNVVFQPGTPVLNLFAEAIALLPPPKRWEATFQTFYTGLPQGIDCRWRGIVAGSEEEALARRNTNALLIDLTRPQAAPASAASQAAREGRQVEPLKTLEQAAPAPRSTGIPQAQSAPQPHPGQRPRPAYTTAPQPDLYSYEPQPLDGLSAGPPGMNPMWDPSRAQRVNRGKAWMIVAAVAGLVTVLGAAGGAFYMLKQKSPITDSPISSLENHNEANQSDEELEAERKREAEEATKQKMIDEQKNKLAATQAKKDAEIAKFKEVWEQLDGQISDRVLLDGLAMKLEELNNLANNEEAKKTPQYFEKVAEFKTAFQESALAGIDSVKLTDIYANREREEFALADDAKVRLEIAYNILSHSIHKDKRDFVKLAETLKSDFAKSEANAAWNKIPILNYVALKPDNDEVMIDVELPDSVIQEIKFKVFANMVDHDYVITKMNDDNNKVLLKRRKKVVRDADDERTLLEFYKNGQKLHVNMKLKASEINGIKNAFLTLEYAGKPRYFGFQKIEYQPSIKPKYKIENNQIVMPLEGLLESGQSLTWTYDKAGYAESDNLAYIATISSKGKKTSPWQEIKSGVSYASMPKYDPRERLSITVTPNNDQLPHNHQLKISGLNLLEYSGKPLVASAKSFSEASSSLFGNYISRMEAMRNNLKARKADLQELQNQKDKIEGLKGKNKEEKLHKFNQDHKADFERLKNEIEHIETSISEMNNQWPSKFMEEHLASMKANTFSDFIKEVILTNCLRDCELRIAAYRIIKFNKDDSIQIPLPLQ